MIGIETATSGEGGGQKTDQDAALRIANLGTMLCSRICHDIAGPVGAIENSLDFVDGGATEAVRKQAVGLLKDSARFLSRSIRFYRLAFGASLGSSTILLTSARDITAEYYDSTKYTLDWSADGVGQYSLDKLGVKAVVNMIWFVATFLPRYGVIKVEMQTENGALQVTVTGSGARVQAPRELANLDQLMATATDYSPASLAEAQLQLMALLVQACEGQLSIVDQGHAENAPFALQASLPLL